MTHTLQPTAHTTPIAAFDTSVGWESEEKIETEPGTAVVPAQSSPRHQVDGATQCQGQPLQQHVSTAVVVR